MKFSLPLLFFIATIGGGHCRQQTPDKGGIAIYWGQNGNEAPLNETCATSRFHYVVITFLNVFGGGRRPQLNLAGHCDPETQSCQFLTHHISFCQSKGVKVLLSLGGAFGNYSLTSTDDARNVSLYLWDTFLGGNNPKITRPLGAAVLDGVDLGIRQGSAVQYGKLVDSLRRQNKSVIVSATPQCPFPDKHIGPALSTRRFDYVWVQFYNNPRCQYDSMSNSTEKLLASWTKWTTSEVVKADKIFLGLPADPRVGEGYVPPEVLIGKILPEIKCSDKYGGVMLWSKYWDELNRNYSAAIAEWA